MSILMSDMIGSRQREHAQNKAKALKIDINYLNEPSAKEIAALRVTGVQLIHVFGFYNFKLSTIKIAAGQE